MTQTTVTYTLEEVLKRIENKIDKLTEKVTTLEIAVAALSEKFDGMDRRVLKLENTLTIQLWALILAVVGAIVKFGFFPNP
jgi:predicted nuclease with TOPRIM domain